MTNAPACWGMLIMGRLCMYRDRGYMGNHCTFNSIGCKSKTALKMKSIVKKRKGNSAHSAPPLGYSDIVTLGGSPNPQQ